MTQSMTCIPLMPATNYSTRTLTATGKQRISAPVAKMHKNPGTPGTTRKLRLKPFSSKSKCSGDSWVRPYHGAVGAIFDQATLCNLVTRMPFIQRIIILFSTLYFYYCHFIQDNRLIKNIQNFNYSFLFLSLLLLNPIKVRTFEQRLC